MTIGTWHNTARLICDVTPDELLEVKKRAKDLGITMRQYIYQSIALRMELEDKKKIKPSPQDLK